MPFVADVSHGTRDVQEVLEELRCKTLVGRIFLRQLRATSEAC